MLCLDDKIPYNRKKREWKRLKKERVSKFKGLDWKDVERKEIYDKISMIENNMSRDHV